MREPSFVRSRVRRLAGLPRAHRLIGRFRAGRCAHALSIAAIQSIEGAFARNASSMADSIFAGISPDACLTRLRADGLSPGLELPQPYVANILRHACETPCSRARHDDERFLIGDVRDGYSPRGYPVAVADVELLPCSVIDRIAQDPMLIETVRRQLGYRPRRVRRRLFWSPVSGLSNDMRRANGQTIDLHYDIDACNSVYVYFYITGADRNSGAHVSLMGSHRDKPLSMVFASCFQPEARVLRRYGTARLTVIEGGPGFGFFEDPGCFHKALVPRSTPRLALQFRYS